MKVKSKASLHSHAANKINQALLENRVTEILLDMAYCNWADELTTSDLQGLAFAEAKRIVKMVKDNG